MEVIDLISSSPPVVALVQTKGKGKQTEAFEDIFSLSSELSVLEDAAFPIEQPSKKQKVNHLPELPVSSRYGNIRSKHDSFFELSSDQDSALRTPTLSRSMVLEPDASNLAQCGSSAPEPLLQRPARDGLVLDLSSDDEDEEKDLIQASSQPAAVLKPVFSQQTARLLAEARNKSSRSGRAASNAPKPPATAEVAGFDRFKRKSRGVTSDAIESSQPNGSNAASNRSEKQNVTEKQTKTTSQKASREQREAEKEAEKQRKLQEREDRQREKQRAADVAEVNKSKTNKKNSTPEMIMQIANSLKGLSMCNQVEEYMKEFGVQIIFTDEPTNGETIGGERTRHKNVITWRRKVTAEYDEDHEIWQPLPQPRVSREDHVLIYLKAEDFVKLAVVGESGDVINAADVSENIQLANLDAHISSLRHQYPRGRLLYLIEGLSAWLKKSENAKNRAYTAAVRAQAVETDSTILDSNLQDIDGNEPPPSTQQRAKTSGSRRKKSNTAIQIDFSSITESITEAWLLYMQLHHQPLLVHHTTSPKTSAAQVSAFTQHLSTRPYRLAAQNANLTSASFCMTTGQIRTGTTANDTWLQMLQEINRVTPSMAYGIVGAGYTNPTELVKAFRQEGRLMLEDVRKSTNKDGGWSDRRLGPMVSKRIHKVFMGKDPAAMDGMA